MTQHKPVPNVKTFDGRVHEVDIRQTAKSFTAWGFVDRRLIEGGTASTLAKALDKWKAEYAEMFGKAKA